MGARRGGLELTGRMMVAAGRAYCCTCAQRKDVLLRTWLLLGAPVAHAQGRADGVLRALVWARRLGRAPGADLARLGELGSNGDAAADNALECRGKGERQRRCARGRRRTEVRRQPRKKKVEEEENERTERKKEKEKKKKEERKRKKKKKEEEKK